MTQMIYPTTNFTAVEQLQLERGEGVYVFDKQGKRYLEGMAGLWCTALGYGNQELVDTAAEQMAKLPYSSLFGGKTHGPGMELADRLSAMVPMDRARVFFGNSGSDANDTHLKLLRYYANAIGKPERRKIITRERAYHGVTLASGGLTSLPANLAHFDAPLEALGILRTDHPHYYHGRQGQESEAEFVARIVDNLERLILAEGPETIMAFIAEPITGASGVIVPPEGYYEALLPVLNKYGILFWSDEVICGFGRTGRDFGVNTMGIGQPDMMTFAKQLSSAYFPISASLIRGDLYEAMVDQCAEVGVFGHGYTYSGHPVGCAVALKALEIYERDDIFAQAAVKGEYLQAQLKSFAEHELVGEVRGRGLIAAIEISADKTTRAGLPPAVANYLAKACQDHGVIVRAVAGNSIALCPPLIISEAQIDEMLDGIANGLAQTLEHVRQEGLLAA
ncbi:MAG: aminotransferase [Pseudomonadota bacterium]